MSSRTLLLCDDLLCARVFIDFDFSLDCRVLGFPRVCLLGFLLSLAIFGDDGVKESFELFFAHLVDDGIPVSAGELISEKFVADWTPFKDVGLLGF